MSEENQYKLVFVSGPLKRQIHELSDKNVLIGRDQDICGLVLPQEDNTSSRIHAFIIYDNGVYTIRNRSRNKTPG